MLQHRVKFPKSIMDNKYTQLTSLSMAQDKKSSEIAKILGLAICRANVYLQLTINKANGKTQN